MPEYPTLGDDANSYSFTQTLEAGDPLTNRPALPDRTAGEPIAIKIPFLADLEFTNNQDVPITFSIERNYRTDGKGGISPAILTQDGIKGTGFPGFKVAPNSTKTINGLQGAGYFYRVQVRPQDELTSTADVTAEFKNPRRTV
jgi:hypothetical protein